MKYISILFFLTISLIAADTESSTPRIPFQCDTARAGMFTLIVDSNAFSGASAFAPVYLEFTLPRGVNLSQTLVGPGLPDIELAPHLNGGLFTEQIDVPADGVRLVRAIEGENSFWIGVFSDSSSWINSFGGNLPPSSLKPVHFYIGIPETVSPINGQGRRNSGSTEIMLDVSQFEGKEVDLQMTSYDGHSTTGIGEPWNPPVRGDLWYEGIQSRPLIAVIQNPDGASLLSQGLTTPGESITLQLQSVSYPNNPTDDKSGAFSITFNPNTLVFKDLTATGDCTSVSDISVDQGAGALTFSTPCSDHHILMNFVVTETGPLGWSPVTIISGSGLFKSYRRTSGGLWITSAQTYQSIINWGTTDILDIVNNINMTSTKTASIH